MRKEYEAFIDAIERCTSAQVEYETQHDDAGANYAGACLVDGLAYNNGAERLADYLELHGIEADAEELLEYCVQLDYYELVSTGIFTSANEFYSKRYNIEQPHWFVLDSWPVQEVETELPLPELSASPFARAFAAKAQDDRRVCVRPNGADSLLSYEATDAVWQARLSIDAIREALADMEA